MPPHVFQELPRPVTAFLLAGCKRKPREALIDCLRELADEGLVRYETDLAGLPLISLGADRSRSGRPLLPFEQVALARVRNRAGRQSLVPFSALVSDDGDDYANWVRQQRDELGQEAQRAGLAAKSAPRGSWRLTLSLAAMASAAVLAVHTVDWKAGDAIAGPVLSAALLALLIPLFLRRWRLTTDGAAAVGAWRHDGGPAPGDCFRSGTGPTDTGRTVWALEGPQAAPLPKGHGWSSFGGQWHTVKLGPLLSEASWSTLSGLGAIGGCALTASFFTVVIGAAGFGFDSEGKLIALTPAALAGVVFVTLWLPAFTSRTALPDDARYHGEIIKLQYIEGDDSPDHYFAWVDDGSHVATKWDLPPGTYQRLSVGDIVQVIWSPRRRRLTDILLASD